MSLQDMTFEPSHPVTVPEDRIAIRVAPSQTGMSRLGRMNMLADLIVKATHRALDAGDWAEVHRLDARFIAVEDAIISEWEARR